MINNVSIIVETGTNGLFIINAMIRSELINIVVIVTYSQSGKQQASITNGLVILYHKSKHQHVLPELTYLYLENFTYKKDFCRSIGNVIFLLCMQNHYLSFVVVITNRIIKDLCNSHALYYYSVHSITSPTIHFMHCQVFNNAKSIFTTLMIYNDIFQSCKDSAVIHIDHSMFYSNTDTTSMVTIKSSSPKCPCALIVKHCNFTYNHIQNIIKMSVNLVNSGIGRSTLLFMKPLFLLMCTLMVLA